MALGELTLAEALVVLKPLTFFVMGMALYAIRKRRNEESSAAPASLTISFFFLWWLSPGLLY